MQQQNDCHVIFGAGPVGQAIMDELLAQGKAVRIINRSGGDFPQGVESVTGDVMDPDFARRAAEGASHVYFALNPPYEKWAELFPPLQQHVLDAAIAAGAKLIVMENLYAYGDTGGQPMTEDMPLKATYKKGRVRAAMTEQLLSAHRAGTVRVTMGRASDFFGPRTLGAMMGELVFYPAVSGKTIQIIGRTDQPHTQTYMPDIGKALVMLALSEQADGQAWHIPSPETITTGDFIKRILAETGTDASTQAASKFMLRVLGLFNPMMREFIETYYQFDQPFIMDHGKFARTFGDIATPLDEAISATVRWFRTNPQSG